MSRYGYEFFSLSIAAIALAGCGGTAVAPSGGGAATAPYAGLSPYVHGRSGIPATGKRRSWMLPEAKSENLVYISDAGTQMVYVYSYPKAALVGTIAETTPEGMCTDAKGDVWISSEVNFQFNEYAHGGTKPIQTISLPGPQLAFACSVDPTTGNLAVTSFCEVSGDTCESNGSVFVYSNFKKAPVQYYVGKAASVYFCGYDSSGDLFVDAYEGPIGPFEFGELVKGASSINVLSLDRPIYYPGGVQWDGKYVAVGDQQAGNQIATSVHQVTVKGNNATIVGTTPLHGANDVPQFWIQGKTIVTPNFGVEAPSDARVYPYPAGGSPSTVFGSSTLNVPIAATVSLAR